jgi:phage gp29-like protein
LWPIDEAGRIIYDAARATPLDPVRHLVHRGHLLQEHRDNWGGPGRAVLFWWLLRGLGRDWFARFMERYGSPFPVGKTDAEDPEAVALLQTAFSLATKIGGLVIDQDDAVELKEAVVAGGAQGHQIWHNVCNDAISKAITGYKSSDKPAGLNAGQSDFQGKVREDIRRFDEGTLGETLRKQLFERFKRFNGLTGEVMVVFGGLSDEDAVSFANLVKTLKEAGWEPTDEAVESMQEKVGIELQRVKAEGGDLKPEGGMGMEKGKDEGGNLKPEKGNGEEIETLAVRREGKLVYFSAGGARLKPKLQTEDPVEGVVEKRIGVLTAAYRGTMAPFRAAILASDSREDCLRRLKATYLDWKPERLEVELESALQMCAAAGADEGKS